jgi:drug/metabolite transporter (DMT)-like permease
MTATILVLVLASAALHPLREFFIKGDATPSGVTLAVVLQFCILAGLQTWITGSDPWAAFQVWPAMLVSGCAILFYYWCLVMTLRTGDLSIYYPITRSSPVFVVVAGFVFLGHSYSPMMLGGIGLVLVGAFLLQYRPGSHLLGQPKTLALATLALCAHGVITLADAEAMKVADPAAYVFVQYIFLTPGMALVFLFTKPPEQSIYRHLVSGWFRTPGRFIIAGVTAYASYYFILWAFQLGADVAAVSAIRQISIPASVLMGCLIFKEERMTARLAWSGLLALGVVVIVLSE